jgi:hypothetical protein
VDWETQLVSRFVVPEIDAILVNGSMSRHGGRMALAAAAMESYLRATGIRLRQAPFTTTERCVQIAGLISKDSTISNSVLSSGFPLNPHGGNSTVATGAAVMFGLSVVCCLSPPTAMKRKTNRDEAAHRNHHPSSPLAA